MRRLGSACGPTAEKRPRGRAPVGKTWCPQGGWVDLLDTPASEDDDDEEEDKDEEKCALCGIADSEPGDEILLCDGEGCGACWHQLCLKPVAVDVPEGDWLCPCCACVRRELIVSS